MPKHKKATRRSTSKAFFLIIKHCAIEINHLHHNFHIYVYIYICTCLKSTSKPTLPWVYYYYFQNTFINFLSKNALQGKVCINKGWAGQVLMETTANPTVPSWQAVSELSEASSAFPANWNCSSWSFRMRTGQCQLEMTCEGWTETRSGGSAGVPCSASDALCR